MQNQIWQLAKRCCLMATYLSRRNFLRVAAVGIGSSAYAPRVFANTPSQELIVVPETKHYKLIKDIVKFYYSGVPILDASDNGFFLRVINDKSPQGIEGLLTRVIFKGKANEIIGVSSYVPHPLRMKREKIDSMDQILAESALRYLIINPSSLTN